MSTKELFNFNIRDSFFWLQLPPWYKNCLTSYFFSTKSVSKVFQKTANFFFYNPINFLFSDALRRRGISASRLKSSRLVAFFSLKIFSLVIGWNLLVSFYDSMFFFFLMHSKKTFFDFAKENSRFLYYFLNKLYFFKSVTKFSSFFENYPREAILKVKMTRTNIFLSVLDGLTFFTLFRISGGYSFLYGAAANKEKAKRRKAKFKVSFKAKKKRKDFKKTSIFSINFMLEKFLLFFKKTDYLFLKFFFLGSTRHYLFKNFLFFLRKNSNFFFLSSIYFQSTQSFNGIRKKKLRRV